MLPGCLQRGRTSLHSCSVLKGLPSLVGVQRPFTVALSSAVHTLPWADGVICIHPFLEGLSLLPAFKWLWVWFFMCSGYEPLVSFVNHRFLLSVCEWPFYSASVCIYQ